MTRREQKAQRMCTAQARFDAAMHGEKLGEHPGQVRATVRVEVYDAAQRRSVSVASEVWGVELLVGSWEELMGAREACVAGLEAWVAGRLAEGQVVCPKCGEGSGKKRRR